MVKLYYTPTSCGAASYIAAKIAGIAFDSEQVILSTHKTASGADFYAINVKGNVPTLVLDDGTVLNEGAAVLQWIADQAAPGVLAPANGTTARYVTQNFLNWTASELHTGVGGLFNPTLSEEGKKNQVAVANRKLDFAEKNLVPATGFLQGETLTVADLYMYIVLSWTGYLGLDLAAYPKVKAFYERVAAQPQVVAGHEAMKAAA